ncbi:MAG: hypothetical protein M3444_00725 [Acidobacteriota bacterium]|nr:hypothetical protein [Acidobacteriota bacterium]MDQ5835845.1 hypothetical protein [Acidobacteriota bacterium]
MRCANTPARLTLLLSVALLAAADAHRASAHLWPASASSFADCEGDACSQVTLTFDESKQQYRAQNNSADRWAKVSASNVAASASTCLAPGAGDYLPIKSIVGPYQAAYDEPKCGVQGGQ